MAYSTIEGEIGWIIKIVYFKEGQKLKKDIYPFVLGLIYGELMTLYGEIFYGLAIRLITLLIIIIKIISKPSLELETKNILRSIILLILFQLTNMSVPRLFNTDFQNFILIYGVMIFPIYSVINNGINSKQLISIISVLLIGAITTIFEYRIFSTNIISTNGEIVTIFLIILLSISFLFAETKYWNGYTSKILDMCSSSLIPVFIAIMIFKITSVI